MGGGEGILQAGMLLLPGHMILCFDCQREGLPGVFLPFTLRAFLKKLYPGHTIARHRTTLPCYSVLILLVFGNNDTPAVHLAI